LLTDWLIGIEDDLDLALAREAERARNYEALANPSQRQLKCRRNPFYPRPLELIRIDLALTIVVANIARGFDTYIPYGGPVPGTESEHAFRVREFLRTDAPSRAVLRFIGDLKRLGYLPYRGEQDVIDWEGWPMVLDNPHRAAARDLLAFLFSVTKDTIRTDLAHTRLRFAYGKYKVAKQHRIYIHKNVVPKSATILRSGWFTRVQNGRVNRYDEGTTFYLQPF
jgi:hypothetical protein